MKKRVACYVMLLLILILDSKTAIEGTKDGIALCMQSVIPSLFPFLMITTMLTGFLGQQTLPMSPVLGIPGHIQKVLILGFLGGYPSGAHAAAQGVRKGSISRENGRNLLAFCSNGGPSFLFGMGAALFPHQWMCWALWGIHILSALLVAQYFPCHPEAESHTRTESDVSLTKAMDRSVRVMAMICGWVILFRVLLNFCDKWILWRFPAWLRILLCGMVELSNGICALGQLESIPLRFILFSTILGFGGFCVATQTYTVAQGLDTSRYLPGKLLQGIFSSLLAASVFSREIGILSAGGILYILVLRKKRIAFPTPVMYNREKSPGRKWSCFSAKRSSPNAPIAPTPQS